VFDHNGPIRGRCVVCDGETAWAWLRFADLTPKSLMGLKNRTSGQFIRDKGLNTTKADALVRA